MANFALNYSFSRNLNIPLDEDAVKATSAMVYTYVTTKNKCYAGQLFSVTGDTESNNGLYMALSTGENGSIIKIGEGGKGNGSIEVANFMEAISAATNDNKGQIVYTDAATYSYIDDEGNTVYTTDKPESGEYKTYESGPYVVTGAGTLTKLGTTSADGADVSSTIESLKAQISTLESYLYWETDGSEDTTE